MTLFKFEVFLVSGLIDFEGTIDLERENQGEKVTQ